jgi:hypothetical protein
MMAAMMKWVLAVLASAVVVVASASAAQAAPPSLSLPIACVIGQTCEVQSYMDDDPGPAAKDYMCGTRAYPVHDGVDFRIPSMAALRAGVPVLAAAPGTVWRVRDGADDVNVRTLPPGAVDRSGCGNAVILNHEDGWRTTYCHMRKGSVRVKPGDVLKAGDPIGLVGLSGNTEFPHVHISVNRGATLIDPFAYGAPAGACGGGKGLWSPAAAAALVYKPRLVFPAGFTADAGDVAKQIDEGVFAAPAVRGASLVAFVRAIGLKQGDVEQLTIAGPDGKPFAQSEAKPVPRDQAQRLLYVGRRTMPPGGWARGVYQALYRVTHDGKTVLERRFSVKL